MLFRELCGIVVLTLGVMVLGFLALLWALAFVSPLVVLLVTAGGAIACVSVQLVLAVRSVKELRQPIPPWVSR